MLSNYCKLVHVLSVLGALLLSPLEPSALAPIEVARRSLSLHDFV
jgi:hypothetical protein